MHRRRLLLGLPISAVALHPTVRTQELHKPLKVGFLSAGGPSQGINGPDPANASARALLQGLRDLGYRYGPDVVLEGRSGEGRADHYVDLARELVAAHVDVIVAAGPTVDAVHRVTSRIPVVMVGGAMDPVEEKL